ncbi:RNA-binding protein 26 [Agrilus planipennis]|uniref:RNA-binding protein 26 n=1 Tax=Agrilus planipennis TaxID=224129 RepID=A0A7F5QVZ2_AGRPL|nr:RNA-binding protein 26 [Agrilus planipennis]
MIIDDPDAFKTWLTAVLKPLCEADPGALAKYVFALVKKDKSEDVLRQSMISQLEVFLQQETESFVNLLFKTLETKEYLTPVIPNANPPNPNVVKAVEIATSRKKEIIPLTHILTHNHIVCTSVLAMIIDDPDAFKTWLTAVLKPLCEADPGALAKYVFALVKKDKSEDVLRQSMISQLEVFLQQETESFVNLLFKTLETKEYLTPVIPNANPPNPNVVKAVEIATSRKKEIIPLSELSSVTETVNGTSKKEKEVEPPRREREIKKSDTEKDERPRRRSRHRSSSRNRSRSRSWDRSRKSRSREKSRERERDLYRLDRDKRDRVRPYRNKSPPRRYDRRRSRTPSPGGKIRSRSRSPRHSYRGRYRNRSPPRSDSRSRSRSRSRSADRKDRKDSARGDTKELKESHSGAATPTQDSNHGDMDMRLTNTTQSIQSVVVHQSSNENRAQKKRCRDYDEKGYCMRGEMCQFDHGADPVVLEDSALSTVLTFTPNTAPVADVAPIIAPPILGTGTHPMMHQIHPRPLPPEYNPQAPQMWHRPGYRGPRPMLGPRVGSMGAFVPPQRELIRVPVMDNQAPEHFGNTYKKQMQYGGNGGSIGIGGIVGQEVDSHHDIIFKKKTFDYNRLGPRAKNAANCSLELKKVPPGLNNITHLNNHFSKFGKIVNIQVSYEGDPEAAIVTFSSHAEANAAYRSTEAVLNNRFIKVFWHSGNNDGKFICLSTLSCMKTSKIIYYLQQIGAEISEEVLLQDDEEEEEDNEGRSWRR